MHTLAPRARSASPLDPTAADLLAQDALAGGEPAVLALTMFIVTILVLLTVRGLGRALGPIIELARAFVAASLAAVLMLAALVLVIVVAVGYV